MDSYVFQVLSLFRTKRPFTREFQFLIGVPPPPKTNTKSMTGRWSFLLKWRLSRDTLIFRGVILSNPSDDGRPHGGRRSIPMRWMLAWDASPCLPWSRWDKSPTSRSLRRRWWGGWWDWWLMRLMGRCLFHVQISETCWVGFFPIRVPNLQNSPYNSIFLDFH